MTAPTWTGTPAEWDAERDRIFAELFAAAKEFYKWETTQPLRKDFFDAMTLAMLPPRPVEPPSVVTASGWRVRYVSDTREFYAEKGERLSSMRSKAHSIAFDTGATEAEHDAIRALRDGPTARYEVCGYEHWRGNKYVQTFHVNDTMTAESCKQSVQFEIIQTQGGGTAHAIYRRVEGDK